jgi:hypothetical protein
MRRSLALIAALLLALGGASALAGSTPLPPPEGRNVQWWGQLPDLVSTDVEFERRGGRDYAFAAAMGSGFRVFDLGDRARPALVGLYPSPSYQNDIQVEDELVVLSSDMPPYPGDPHHPVCGACEAFEGVELVDVSIPTAPRRLAKLWIEGGAHNSTLAGEVLYVSNPSSRAMDVVDVSRPRAPRVVLRVAEAAGCAQSPYPCQVVAPGEDDWRPHDITVRPAPGGGHRLYVAAIEATFILEVDRHVLERRRRDSVRVVAKIPNGDPASYANLEIAHQADPSPDGRLLVVSDERGGGISEIGCPGGGLHVYDLSHAARPRKLGVYFAPDTHPHGNCTVHVFRFLPDRSVLTTAWYAAGSWVVDVSGPASPGELDNRTARPGQQTTWGRTLGFAVMPGADTWATKSPGTTGDGRLFMYSGDMVRGMDVFEFTGRLPPAGQRGPTWRPRLRAPAPGERE